MPVPYAGRHLADILSRTETAAGSAPQAAHYIGLVGYLDAIPALERILARLEARAIRAASRCHLHLQGSLMRRTLLPEIRTALRVYTGRKVITAEVAGSWDRPPHQL